MVRRGELRMAGAAALVTSLLLLPSLVLFPAHPPSSHPSAVLAWHAEHGMLLRVGAVLWLGAMLSLVVFAITFREAMWTSVLDRSWTTVLFLEGAGIFAVVAVVAAALGWAITDQAQAGAMSAELAGAVWRVQRALLRFAGWGLAVPLVVVGTALHRHSLLGQICAVGAFVVAGGLLVPLSQDAALYALCAWLALAGLTLLVPERSNADRSDSALPR